MFFMHNLHRSKLVVLVSLLSSNIDLEICNYKKLLFINLECEIYTNQEEDQKHKKLKMDSQVFKVTHMYSEVLKGQEH